MLALVRAYLVRDHLDALRREAAQSRLRREAAQGRQAREAGRPASRTEPRTGTPTSHGPGPAPDASVQQDARRRLVGETVAVHIPVIAFGLVYGMAARAAGFTFLDLEAMNLLVFAGGSQLMAIGLLAAGLPWLPIVAVTALLNARHLLYGASLAPWFARRPLVGRALAAYVVVDESFALTVAHCRRLGRFDPGGYAFVAITLVVTWLASTGIGWATARGIPQGFADLLHVLVPASMAGLAALLVIDRATLVSAALAATIGVGLGALVSPAIGIVTGGLLGPLAAVVLGSRGRLALGEGVRTPIGARSRGWPGQPAESTRQPAGG